MNRLKIILLLTTCFTALTMPRSASGFSIAAKGSIDLFGNTISSDSFDSADPNYSTTGLYDPTKNKDNGDMLLTGQLTNSVLSIGNAEIMGHIIGGPDSIYQIGPNGSIGSKAWVESMKGIQPGWASFGLAFYFPDAALPSTTWLPTGIPGSPVGGAGVAPNGIFYDHVFTSSIASDYVITDNGSIYVGTNLNVRLKVLTSTYYPSKIYVAGTGATAGRVTVYLTGASAILTTSHMTESANAANLVFFGLPTCTSINYSGGGNFTGVIYAPQAEFRLSGGTSTVHFVGSCVVRTVLASGHCNFHFDENLRRIFPFANPIFLSPLQNKTVVAGQNPTFTVSAISNLPLTYQWSFLSLDASSSVPIPNATNNTVTITNVSAENQGHYFVVVSNAMISATSSNALLTVLSPAPVLSQPFSPASGQIQFDIVGIAGSNYLVQASTNCVDWSPMVTNISPFTFVETNASGFPARFYRAVYLP